MMDISRKSLFNNLLVKRRQISLWIVVSALFGFGSFIFSANFAFYTPVAANLPCRNCVGDARSVHINGFDLYFRELGSTNPGTPIVILHGGPGHSSESFKGVFDFLANQFRVIFYDQRGSGNSQILPDISNYNIQALVEELETLRETEIKADKIILVAHSFGGALAQRYALAHPEHVEKMILVSSVQINNGIESPLLTDLFMPSLYAFGPGLPPADPLVANEWFGRLNFQTSIPRLYDPSNTTIIENSGYISFATWRAVSQSVEGQNFAEELRHLQIPTLITYGAADSSATGEPTAQSLHELLPNSTLARFEQSGHWAFLEQPALFSQVILDFL